MHIIDTYPHIGRCLEEGHFSRRGWAAYMDEACPGIRLPVEEDIADYDYTRDILPVLEAAFTDPLRLETMHSSFLSATEGLEERIRSELGTQIDAELILYMGLCSGAGWATRIGDRPTVLLGMEKILELNWIDRDSMIGLIYHELGHLWHFGQRRAPAFAPEDRALWQLYTEGMAMYCEQRLCQDAHYYHQDRSGWLAWCEENRSRLFAEYRSRADAGESVQDFFGDWCSFEGKSDVGYFLGAELVRSMTAWHASDALFDLSAEDIHAALAQQ